MYKDKVVKKTIVRKKGTIREKILKLRVKEPMQMKVVFIRYGKI